MEEEVRQSREAMEAARIDLEKKRSQTEQIRQKAENMGRLVDGYRQEETLAAGLAEQAQQRQTETIRWYNGRIPDQTFQIPEGARAGEFWALEEKERIPALNAVRKLTGEPLEKAREEYENLIKGWNQSFASDSERSGDSGSQEKQEEQPKKKPLPSLEQYYKLQEDMKTRRKALQLENHDKENAEHQKRKQIRTVIEEYNKTGKLQLPGYFADLEKQSKKDPGGYDKSMNALTEYLSSKPESDGLKKYLRDFDTVMKGERDLREIEESLKKAVADENRLRDEINEAIRKGRKEYQKALEQISREDKERFDQEMEEVKAARDEAKGRADKYRTVAAAVNPLTDALRNFSAVLTVAHIKGQLKEQEGEIETLKQQIEEREQAIRGDRLGLAHSHIEAVRQMNESGHSVIRDRSGVILTGVEQVDRIQMGRAERAERSRQTEESLNQMRARLNQMQQNYADTKKQVEEAAWEQMDQYFGAGFSRSTQNAGENSQPQQTEETFTERDRLLQQIDLESSVMRNMPKVSLLMAQRQAETRLEDRNRMVQEAKNSELAKKNNELRISVEKGSDKKAGLFTGQNQKMIDTAVDAVGGVVKLVNVIRGAGNGGSAGQGTAQEGADQGIGTKLDQIRNQLEAMNQEPVNDEDHYAVKGIRILQELYKKAESIRSDLNMSAEVAQQSADIQSGILEEKQAQRKQYEERRKASKGSSGTDFLFAQATYLLNACETEKSLCQQQKDLSREFRKEAESRKKLLDQKLIHAETELTESEATYQSKEQAIQQKLQAIQQKKEEIEQEKLREFEQKLEENSSSRKKLDEETMQKAETYKNLLEFCAQYQRLDESALRQRLQDEIDQRRPDNLHIQALSMMIVDGPEKTMNGYREKMNRILSLHGTEMQKLRDERKELKASRSAGAAVEVCSFQELAAEEQRERADSRSQGITQTRSQVQNQKQIQTPERTQGGRGR